MKRSRFYADQIACALRQAELAISAKESCRKMGIRDAPCYVWHKSGIVLHPPSPNACAKLRTRTAKSKQIVSELNVHMAMSQTAKRATR